MILNRIKRVVNKGGLILMYHRVKETDNDPWNIAVSPKNFEEHLNVLKKNFRVIGLKDYMKIRKNVRYTLRRYVVITFDDGMADNFYNAKNLLEKYDLPATIFITTFYIGLRTEFWWNQIVKHVYNNNSEALKSIISILDDSGVNLSHSAGKLELCKTLQIKLQNLDYDKRLLLVEKLNMIDQNDFSIDRDDLPLNSDQIYRMSNASVFEIGAHTKTHPLLSRLDYENQKKEIESGKTILEDIINKKVISFSYPHGDYTATTLQIMRNSQYKYGCTIKKGKVYKNTDPYRIPRIKILNWNGEEFNKHIALYR